MIGSGISIQSSSSLCFSLRGFRVFFFSCTLRDTSLVVFTELSILLCYEGCLPFDQKIRLFDRCGKWKASKLEWEFPYGICCSIYISKRSNPKGLELVRKSEWNAQFPFGNSVWEFWSTFQEIPFSPEIFHLRRLN